MTHQVVGKICLEVLTENCICDKGPCGGVEHAHVLCLEHGDTLNEVLPIHSHPLLIRRKIVRTKAKA